MKVVIDNSIHSLSFQSKLDALAAAFNIAHDIHECRARNIVDSNYQISGNNRWVTGESGIRGVVRHVFESLHESAPVRSLRNVETDPMRSFNHNRVDDAFVVTLRRGRPGHWRRGSGGRSEGLGRGHRRRMGCRRDLGPNHRSSLMRCLGRCRGCRRSRARHRGELRRNHWTSRGLSGLLRFLRCPLRCER